MRALLAPFILLFLVAAMWLNCGVLSFLDISGLSARLNKFRVRRRYGRVRVGGAIDPARVEAVLAAFRTASGLRQTGEPKVACVNGQLGVRVRLVPDGAPVVGAPKYAWYVEGSHFEMGVLLGMLAEPGVRRMSVEYVNNVIFDFMKVKGDFSILGRIAADFIYLAARYSDVLVPDELSAEIWGLWQGCKLADPDSAISLRKLFVLNYGIDIILSWVYSGAESLLRLVGLDVKNYRPPVACNGFASMGQDFWFGRDFMFPTCGAVFGESAGHIVYNSTGEISPRDAQRGKPRGMLWQAPGRGLRPASLQLVFGAPGMVGAITTLNAHGLAMGVDMINSHSCNWRQVGLNSLMMIRFITAYSSTAPEAVDLMARLPRGVSWLYLLASTAKPGTGQPDDRAAAIEAAMKTDRADWLRFTPTRLKALLPDADFIKAHAGGPDRHGLMVRWNDWQQDQDWLDFNQGLFEHFGPWWPKVKDQWGSDGMLCQSRRDFSLPGPFYFAPQRDARADLMLAGNNFIMPEMRLLAMSDWSAGITPMEDTCDFQWRYDVLNRKLSQALARGPLDHDAVRDIINFLRPYNTDGGKAEFHAYNGVVTHPDGSQTDIPFDQVPVSGSVSLVDLRRLRLETLYDHYADPWVAVSLQAFVEFVASQG